MNDERATEIPRDATSREAPRPVGEDDPLGAALRALPAERAGAGFTGRVLARLDEGDAARAVPGRSGSQGPRPGVLGPVAWAALAAAILAVALGLALVRGSSPAPESAVATSEPAVATSEPVPPETRPASAPGDPTPPVELEPPSTAADSAEPAAAHRRPDRSPRRAPEARRAAHSGAVPSGAVPSGAASDDPRAVLARVRAELDDLRRDHRRFEVALAELPEIGRDGQPVVFLGGDEELGLVLDLGREAPAGDDPEPGQRSPSL